MSHVLVTIPGVPARLFLEMLDHVRTVVREFALIRGGLETGTSTPDLPTELVGRLNRILVQYDAEAELIRTQAEKALASGHETFEVRVDLPPKEAREATVAFLATVEQIDEIAQEGDVLLTPPSPPAVADFRRWYVARVLAALDHGGAAPLP